MQWVVHREGESTGYRDSQRIAAMPFVRAGEMHSQRCFGGLTFLRNGLRTDSGRDLVN